MVGEPPFVSERQHLVVHLHGVAYAQHVDAAVNEPFANPVNRHVALRAHKHLVLAAQRLVDGLHEGCRLARARRSVYDGHVLGAEYVVHRLFLRRVKPGEAYGVKRECLGLLPRAEQVAQVGQSVAFGVDDTVQGFEHQLVSGFVEEQLHAHVSRGLQLGERRVVRHGDYHPVAVNVAYGAREEEISPSRPPLWGGAWFVLFGVLTPPYRGGWEGLLNEEHHGAAELEVVFNLVVLRAQHFHGQLVQRVVVTLAHADGKPCVAALHLALQAHGFGLAAELFLLAVVFHLKQQLVLHENLYG